MVVGLETGGRWLTSPNFLHFKSRLFHICQIHFKQIIFFWLYWHTTISKAMTQKIVDWCNFNGEAKCKNELISKMQQPCSSGLDNYREKSPAVKLNFYSVSLWKMSSAQSSQQSLPFVLHRIGLRKSHKENNLRQMRTSQCPSQPRWHKCQWESSKKILVFGNIASLPLTFAICTPHRSQMAMSWIFKEITF